MDENNLSLDNPREIALKILYDIEINSAFSDLSLNKNLNFYNLKPIDRPFITNLVYGVIKNKTRIDWVISKFSNTPIKKMSPWVLNILRLGVYQIIYMDKVPHSAAVNEMVALGKKYGHKKISGFINAILRNITRASKNNLQPSKKNKIDFLTVYYSHPKWMVEMWVKEFGLDFTEKLLISNNENPPINVRTNTLKTTRPELMKRLNEEGISSIEGPWCPEALIIENISHLDKISSFQEGLFQVQDQSSMLVGHILSPQKHQLIIDICAAPGGKTTHIAELMKDKGKIIARDIHKHKITLMGKNIRRLGIKNIILELFNGLNLDKDLISKADGVLLDAPCSGLGIIRKKPDLKWNKTVENIKDLTRLQTQLLETSSKYVKKDGFLIYSTCTINPEENIKIVNNFLNKNSNFKLVEIIPISKKIESHKEIKKGYLQTYPHIDGIDGFFISKMQRF